MKETLLEFLRYCTRRVENDQCTIEEINSAVKVFAEELEVKGTVSDFSAFFAQPESNVRNVLSRRYCPPDRKPRRRVLYDFAWFRSLVPRSWHK